MGPSPFGPLTCDGPEGGCQASPRPSPAASPSPGPSPLQPQRLSFGNSPVIHGRTGARSGAEAPSSVRVSHVCIESRPTGSSVGWGSAASAGEAAETPGSKRRAPVWLEDEADLAEQRPLSPLSPWSDVAATSTARIDKGTPRSASSLSASAIKGDPLAAFEIFDCEAYDPDRKLPAAKSNIKVHKPASKRLKSPWGLPVRPSPPARASAPPKQSPPPLPTPSAAAAHGKAAVRGGLTVGKQFKFRITECPIFESAQGGGSAAALYARFAARRAAHMPAGNAAAKGEQARQRREQQQALRKQRAEERARAAAQRKEARQAGAAAAAKGESEGGMLAQRTAQPAAVQQAGGQPRWRG